MKKNYLFLLFLISYVVGINAVEPTVLPIPTNNPNSVFSFWGYYKNTFGLNNQATVDDWYGGFAPNAYGIITKPSVANGVISPQMKYNVSGMTHLHIDLWAETANQNINIQFINYDNDVRTIAVTKTNGAVINSWVGFDIPFTDIPTLASDLNNIIDVIFLGGDGIVYIGNVYLYDNNGEPGPMTSAAMPPSRPADSYLSLYSNTYGDIPNNNWSAYNESSGTVTSSEYLLASSDQCRKLKYNGAAGKHAIYEWSSGAKDITQYSYMYFDIWVNEALPENWLYACLYNPDPSSIGYAYLRSPVPAISAGETGRWVSCQIEISDFVRSWGDFDMDIVLKNLNSIRFFSDQTVTNKNIYIDNIYFYFSTEPDRAPTPADFPENIVIPVYGQYVSIPSYTWTNQLSYEDETDHNVSANVVLSSTPSVLTPNSALSLTTTSGNIANVMYLNVWVAQVSTDLKIKLNGTSTIYTVPAGALRSGAWNTLRLPLKRFGPGINQINRIEFTGSGIVYIDNVYFYYSEINPDVVAELYIDNVSQGTFYTISEAVNSVPTEGVEGKNIEIAIFSDSNEPATINIPVGKWNMLTIYPQGNAGDIRTVTHIGSSDYVLFNFAKEAANVTISGKLNKTGASRSLVIQGQYMPSNESNPNAIIGANDNKNITIADCKFRGQSTDNRPEKVFNGNGNNMTIRNNYFENCLYLGDLYNHSDNAIITIFASGSTNLGWEISGNDFYETQPVYFTTSLYRIFINIVTNDVSNNDLYAIPVKIQNNKIGGSGRDASGNITGTMTIGSQVSGATSSFLFGIQCVEGWPDGNNYSLIEGNEIAHINILNPTAGIWRLVNNTYNWVEDYLGEFTAIATLEGKINIRGNKIHDISNTSQPHTNPTNYSYLLLGIRSEAYGGNCNYIIEGNHIYDLFGDLLEDRPAQNAQIAGITNRAQNSYNFTTKAIVRDNRVIMGYKGTKKMNLSFSAISGSLYEISGSGADAQLDVYNNISVINEFKYIDGLAGSQSILTLSNASGNDKGLINCYNNIVYIQPKEAYSFSGLKNLLGGIRYGSSSGTVNIFHNTVFLKEMGLGEDDIHPTVFNIEFWNGIQTLNVWNNNFVNLNDKGTVLNVSGNSPGSFYIDYNNYFVLENGQMANVSKSFDNWKFSNTLDFLDKTTEHDHHSRFLDPQFSSTADVVLSMAGIDNLRPNLIPNRFLGGRKSTIAELGGLLASLDDNSNTDYSLTPIKRRAYLPTMGALNTGFSNYWTGAVNTNWATSGNWSSGQVPGTTSGAIDVVMAENPSNNLILNADRIIHDFYNDTQTLLDLGGNSLTFTGYIGQERYLSTIDASSDGSTVVYNGLGNGATSGTSAIGSAAQHIFKNTFLNNQVNNLSLDNQSEYFVLLHGEMNKEPVAVTLDILNDFAINNPNTDLITYPDGETGLHTGALNCIQYNTTLQFSGYTSSNTPDLSATLSDYADGRIDVGQRIPRHGIFNDELYNLINNSSKVISYHDYLYINNQLTINADKNFEIVADKYVQVRGLTQNNGGAGGLTIRSRTLNEPYPDGITLDDTQKADYVVQFDKLFEKGSSVPRPNATFIYSNGHGSISNTAVPATVEMHSPAKYDPDGPDGYKYSWQYFTVPVDNIAPFPTFEGSWIRRWDPSGTNRDASKGTPYWLYVNWEYPDPEVDYLHAMRGYEITQREEKIIPIAGNLINQDMSLKLDYYTYDSNLPGSEDWDDEQFAMNGQYVIGNPFTAAIDINKLEFGDNLQKTVYIYNTGSYASWRESQESGSGGEGTGPGQYLVIPQNASGTINITSIPSMQGFVIKRLSGTGTDVQNTYDVKYNQATETVGKNEEGLRSSTDREKLRHTIVDLSSKNYQDRLWLLINPDCKKGFDNGWDGEKFLNITSSAQIFTMEDNENYQVSTTNDLNGLFLGMKAGSEDSEYTLTFTHFGMDEEYKKIYLTDLFESKLIDITESGSKYIFKTNTEDSEQRFVILSEKINTEIDSQPNSPENIHIYSSGKTVIVDNMSLTDGQMTLYTISGNQLMTRPVEKYTNRYETTLSPGVYVVKVITAAENVNKMIIIK